MSIEGELTTYLNDHLAGSTAARDLIDRAASSTQGTALGTFLSTLLRDIESDRSELRAIMRRLDVGEQTVKQAAGAIGERLSRFKFDVLDRSGGDLNRVLELESMLMGIEGKAALWRTLKVVAASESRLADVDLDRLAARARDQQEGVERHRRELLSSLFA
jgi:hypothetical protein